MNEECLLFTGNEIISYSYFSPLSFITIAVFVFSLSFFGCAVWQPVKCRYMLSRTKRGVTGRLCRDNERSPQRMYKK